MTETEKTEKDYFASLIEDTDRRDLYNETNGIHTVLLEKGHSAVEAALRPDHKNIWGIPHGGILFAVADVAAGIAADSLREGMHLVTAGSSMNFLSANPDAKTLRGEGRVIKAGRHIIIVQSDVYDELGTHLVTAQFTMFNAKQTARSR